MIFCQVQNSEQNIAVVHCLVELGDLCHKLVNVLRVIASLDKHNLLIEIVSHRVECGWLDVEDSFLGQLFHSHTGDETQEYERVD